MKLVAAGAAAGVLLVAGTAGAAVGQGELRDLYSSAEFLGMGNAGVAMVDDENSLYYNPAGLAGVKTPKLNLVDLQVETSGDFVTEASSSVSSFKNLNSSSLNQFFGKEIYARATVTPSFVAGGFGVGFIVDQQVALYPENLALPAVTLGYQTTNGITAGYGYSFYPGGGRHNRDARDEIRVGLGAELLFRRGGYNALSLLQVANLNETEFKSLTGNFGEGLGVNAGVQYIRRQNKQLTLMAGASFENIGDTSFSVPTAETQQGDLSLGVAAKYEMPGLGFTAAYDLKNLNESTDMRMRQHAGVQVKIPLFAVQAGVNEISYTYGLTADLFLVKASFVSYAEELAAEAGLATERRYMLRVELSL